MNSLPIINKKSLEQLGKKKLSWMAKKEKWKKSIGWNICKSNEYTLYRFRSIVWKRIISRAKTLNLD